MGCGVWCMGLAREGTIALIRQQFKFLDKDGSGYLDGSDMNIVTRLQETSLEKLMLRTSLMLRALC